jgi:hypothetical protein
VTYVEADGDHVGALADGQVHALPSGVTLLDLLRAEDVLREAGERALATRLGGVRIGLGEHAVVRVAAPVGAAGEPEPGRHGAFRSVWVYS